MAELYDVAVVGCGPVGAVAAHLFGQAGLKTLVIEREAEPHPLPRAVHLDHEMMRIFQGLGLVDRLEPLMRATHGHVHIGADGGVIRYLGAYGKPRRFGWANDYFFYQPELEAELRGALKRYPHVELRLGAELTGLSQDAEAATLTLADGTTAQARYVVACDGSRSAVRKALGVRLDDLDFEEPWLVVDAEVEGPISFPAFAGLPDEADLQNLSVMLCDPRRPATIVPGRGTHRRWEFMLLPGEDDQAMMAPERVAELVAPWVQGSPHRIVRATTYRFHGLVAEQWRVGRVLLAGDAAHQTPPFFGQGMCHGLRDAANLAWKLKLVLRGAADARLLDTYQAERDPHVRAVIGAAVAAGRYICVLDPEAAAARDAQVREAARSTGPSTAADLIPPIRAGVVAEGAGERFIQPRAATVGGGEGLLDDFTGGGFLLLSLDAELVAGLGRLGRARLNRLEAASFVIATRDAHAEAADLVDVAGDLEAWFAAKGARAAIIRPDFYVYGVAANAEELAALLERLGDELGLPAPDAVSPAAAPCSA
jgi:3-(3-hydroxy-phenyl)propionate hydroxylase